MIHDQQFSFLYLAWAANWRKQKSFTIKIVCLLFDYDYEKNKQKSDINKHQCHEL